LPVIRRLAIESEMMETRQKDMFKNIFSSTTGRRLADTHFVNVEICRGGSMPYPTGHRAEVKKRIIASARGLFNRRGFEQVSLDEIMLGAGLTHGGFYSYFKSKSDLYVEALNCFFTDPEWKNCWEGCEVDLQSTDVGGQVIRAYLSRQHFEDVENSCPMVALPADVTRGGVRLKRAFETVFAAMVSILERSVNGTGHRSGRDSSRNSGRNARSRAQAMAALCIGGMVVARAMENRASADALRDACMKVALELGGWQQPKAATNARRAVATRRRPVASPAN
jgi:TetR/AcrR family transcriptional regulator, transcriptional repressor for nem operon